jgi:hypothetical protein
MRRITTFVAAVLVVGTTCFAGATTSARAATIPLPTADPFYTYTGKTPLAQVKPGSILLDAAGKPVERQVSLALNTTTNPLPAGDSPILTAEQILYRTSDELGHPSATVTTIIVPAAAAVAPKIVAYLSFYDSLSSKCDPSYTLRGGDPNVGVASGTPNTDLTDVEQALVQTYAADGDVVTVPDFEGEHLDWTAGHEAGYGTLDAIRATEAYLKAPATTPAALTGYSGGSIAADWASELAPAYAPQLNIVGVAEGGIPVDFAHNLNYINGDADWSGIIPAVLDALSRSYGFGLSTYLSPLGEKLAAQDRDECIGEFEGNPATAGLTIQQVLKPQYKNPYTIPAFVEIINKLIMGTAPGHPKGPLLMEVGNDPNRAPDGVGDDIMVTADVEALAHEYCAQGVSVDYIEATGLAHTEAAVPFEAAAVPFLQARLTGAPVVSTCATIGVGNSLAPVTLVHAAPSTATGSRAGAISSPSSGASRQGDLAFTGSDPLVAVVALVLVGAGAAARAARRHR